MLRAIILAAAAAFVMTTAMDDAQAQAAKKCRRTMEQCIESCKKVGGRYCPAYCQKQQVDTGCP
jgi:type II secretory pathway pseudopilin PulG